MASFALGLCHGVGDASAGFVLGALATHTPITAWAPLVLTYNLAAFGLQPLLAPPARRCHRVTGAGRCDSTAGGRATALGLFAAPGVIGLTPDAGPAVHGDLAVAGLLDGHQNLFTSNPVILQERVNTRYVRPPLVALRFCSLFARQRSTEALDVLIDCRG